MQRRRFLKRTGAAVAASVALGGCGDRIDDQDRERSADPNTDPETPATDVEPAEPSGFGEIVDLTEHGADPRGVESIVPVLNDVVENGTIARLPQGRYRMDERWDLRDVTHFGIIGDDATIVPPEGNESFLFRIESTDAARSVLIEGLTFDLSASDTGGRILDAKVADGLLVRDVTALGTADRGSNLVRIDVTDPDGTGRVERLRLADGAEPTTGITGCFVGDRNRGDIVFEDCHIEGFPDNGLYADPPAGSMHVVRGYYANSGIANVRVRGGSTVRGAYVRLDETHRDFPNMRGIRLTDFSPQPDADPALVENCFVDVRDRTYSDGAIVLNGRLAGATIRDTHVHVDPDGMNAIRVKPLVEELENEPDLPRVHLDGVTITGSAGETEAVRIDQRDECTLEDLHVQQSGPDRNGVAFTLSRDNDLSDTRFDVTGEPVVLNESTVNQENVTVGGSRNGDSN